MMRTDARDVLLFIHRVLPPCQKPEAFSTDNAAPIFTQWIRSEQLTSFQLHSQKCCFYSCFSRLVTILMTRDLTWTWRSKTRDLRHDHWNDLGLDFPERNEWTSLKTSTKQLVACMQIAAKEPEISLPTFTFFFLVKTRCLHHPECNSNADSLDSWRFRWGSSS